MTLEQWEIVAEIMKKRGLIAFFDSAYQGFASGSVGEDGAPVGIFLDKNLEVVVAQSNSKSLGFYGERTRCLCVVTDQAATGLVANQWKYILELGVAVLPLVHELSPP